MNKADLIIIGSGISGLSLAHYCAKNGMNTIVLEKEDIAGGTFHTHHYENDQSEDFWIELGAHTCYNSYRNLIGIIEDCQIVGKLFSREKVPFKIYHKQKIKSIVSQLHFSELLLTVPKLFSLTKQGSTIKEYYSKLIGKKNYQKLFRHLFNGVLSQTADDFPAEMIFKKRPRRKDILKKFTLTAGLQLIIDKIILERDISLMPQKAVQTIQYSDNRFLISTADNSQYEAPMLALATPADVAAQLLQDTFADIAAELKKIEVVQVKSTGVIIKKNQLPLKPLAGLVSTDDSFYSIISRDVVQHDKYRGFTFHFKPNCLDQEGQYKKMAEVLNVDSNQFAEVTEKTNVVPSLTIDHEQKIKKITGLLVDKPLLLTGNYFSGIAIEECISRSLSESNRALQFYKIS